jgi:transcriptional regulator with XRE-family HTH domain
MSPPRKPAPPRETLSEQLRRAIRARGMSLSALAEESGVDRAVLSRFAAGTRTITIETADRLAAVLRLRFAPGR